MENNLGVAQIWLEEAHENNLTPASEQMIFTLQLSLSLRNPPPYPLSTHLVHFWMQTDKDC